MLELDVFTLFPHWFAWLSEERAVQNSLGSSARLRLLSLRDFSPLRHAQVRPSLTCDPARRAR